MTDRRYLSASGAPSHLPRDQLDTGSTPAALAPSGVLHTVMPPTGDLDRAQLNGRDRDAPLTVPQAPPIAQAPPVAQTPSVAQAPPAMPVLQKPPAKPVAGQTETVEILLATYNSATYLAPLMDSLLAQSVDDFHLVISDDCSSDETLTLLQPYLDRFRHPVRLSVRDTPSGSAMANFAGMMQDSTADYVFLCDADDIWHADKLALFLDRIRTTEARLGADVPIFLYSDAEIIDGDGTVQHASYWAFKKIVPARCTRLPALLVCAPMLGCASVMNRALMQLAHDVPVDDVTGHDWWAILVAGAMGHVDYLNARTISYRIHGNNSSQPKEVTIGALSKLSGDGVTPLSTGFLSTNPLSGPAHEVRRRLDIRRQQAAPLLDQFAHRLPQDQRRVVERFIAICDKSFLGRRLALFWHGYTYPDMVRNTALLLFC